MTRLIDADALHEQFYDLTKFKKDKHTGDWVSQRSVKISDALRMINDAPTVDAIEAVDDTEWVAVRRNEYEDFLASAETVKVAYICDGRKCDSDCSECFRTLDIEHARDFKLMGDTYFQQEAEAEQKVIRSRTLMPTKDFKEWAKRVREENGENVIVIPCDAEVADRPMGEWRVVATTKPMYDRMGVLCWGSVYKCDQCDFTTWAVEGHFSQYNFCPNCGARMTPYKGGDK